MLPHLKTALQKTARYCAYQERSHKEVYNKLRTLKLTVDEANEVISTLIQDDYLSEERYACLYARSKFNQKKWGKVKIKQELKFKDVSPRNIKKALEEIDQDIYISVLIELIQKKETQEKSTNEGIKLKKKVCDFVLRKGFESYLVYEVYGDLYEK